MCRICEEMISSHWNQLLVGENHTTPDFFKHKVFEISETNAHRIKIMPQQLAIPRSAFIAAIHYLREHNHYSDSPCEIRSSNNRHTAGPLCKASRDQNNNLRCITYILPILKKLMIVGINPNRPNKTWLLNR